MDRNVSGRRSAQHSPQSLSARRAWIEINQQIKKYNAVTVALRKESVDRNLDGKKNAAEASRSLSARRAWIEIELGKSAFIKIGSRSPQGERG